MDFYQFYNKNKERKFAICSHMKADVDAIASSFALSKIFPNSVLCSLDEMNLGAKLLSEKAGIKTEPIENLNPKNFDGLIITDTSSYTLLPEAKKWKIACIVDHHRKEGRDMNSDCMAIDEESPSCAEIITKLIKEQGLEITKDMAFALAVAVIADGARFKSARKETFATLSYLMGLCHAEYNELLYYAEPPQEIEGRMEILKTLKKTEIITCGTYLVVTSIAENKESDAASILADIADAAFIASWKKDKKETRVSARGNKTLPIKLNEIMKQVGTSLGGDGGGHYKAAGASCKAKPKEVLEKCIDVFISKL